MENPNVNGGERRRGQGGQDVCGDEMTTTRHSRKSNRRLIPHNSTEEKRGDKREGEGEEEEERRHRTQCTITVML